MMKSDRFIAYYFYHFLYMYSDQCISITDLRRKTASYIGSDVPSEQFIFVGSKPMNVLITMSRYEQLRRMEDVLYEQDLDFHFVPYNELSEEEKRAYDKNIARDNSLFIDF